MALLRRASFLAPLTRTEITSLSLVGVLLAEQPGSGQQSSPAPTTLSVISKILAFATTLTHPV